ncbi:MAG TPA: hypothetical protein VL728_00235 [Cyclobacteriaceae bacterium]|nr:hypothetical protein [Cyclobacteriaceae bacterium]
MNKATLYTTSLIVSIGVTLVGAYFKIQHLETARFWLSLGAILAIPFVYLGIIDAFTDRKNESVVKLMWGVGFIFLAWIAGFAYLGNFKKRNAA